MADGNHSEKPLCRNMSINVRLILMKFDKAHFLPTADQTLKFPIFANPIATANNIKIDKLQ